MDMRSINEIIQKVKVVVLFLIWLISYLYTLKYVMIGIIAVLMLYTIILIAPELTEMELEIRLTATQWCIMLILPALAMSMQTICNWAEKKLEEYNNDNCN